MSATPHANGGRIRTALDRLPHLAVFAAEVGTTASATGTLVGRGSPTLIQRNPSTFRLFGPDETVSNKLDAVFDVTSPRLARPSAASTTSTSAHTGRVTEVLSEHLLEGMLEGYVLSGRHGLINTYEAFAHIIDSMVGQHAKWLESSTDIDWRARCRPVDPALVARLAAGPQRVLAPGPRASSTSSRRSSRTSSGSSSPPDANTLLAVAAHAMETTDRIEVIVAGKHPEPVFLSLEDAVAHVDAGAGVWEWAGTEDRPDRPTADVVLVCAGDVPTVETVAAADIIRKHAPSVGVRVVNVVDLLALGDPRKHEHPLATSATTSSSCPGPRRCSPSTATRRSCTSSPTVGTGTTTCTCTASSSRARPRRRSTCSCATRWTASRWRTTPSPGVDADAHADLLGKLSEARDAAREYAYTKGEDHPSVGGWEFAGWPQDEPASGGTGGDPGAGESEGAAPGR